MRKASEAAGGDHPEPRALRTRHHQAGHGRPRDKAGGRLRERGRVVGQRGQRKTDVAWSRRCWRADTITGLGRKAHGYACVSAIENGSDPNECVNANASASEAPPARRRLCRTRQRDRGQLDGDTLHRRRLWRKPDGERARRSADGSSGRESGRGQEGTVGGPWNAVEVEVEGRERD